MSTSAWGEDEYQATPIIDETPAPEQAAPAARTDKPKRGPSRRRANTGGLPAGTVRAVLERYEQISRADEDVRALAAKIAGADSADPISLTEASFGKVDAANGAADLRKLHDTLVEDGELDVMVAVQMLNADKLRGVCSMLDALGQPGFTGRLGTGDPKLALSVTKTLGKLDDSHWSQLDAARELLS